MSRTGYVAQEVVVDDGVVMETVGDNDNGFAEGVSYEITIPPTRKAPYGAAAAATGTYSNRYTDIDEVAPNSQCRICGGRATGAHYGCLSCEACKGFFKRTVEKDLQYNCRDGVCSINKFNRNNCAFCRYQKCLEQGMRREAIYELMTSVDRDDDDDSEDESEEENRSKGRYNYDESVLQPPIFVEPEVIGNPELHGMTLEDEDEVLENLLESEADTMPAGDAAFILAKASDSDPEATQIQLREYCFQDLRLAIDWAKRLHSFQEILAEDQLTLIRATFLQLCCLRLTFRSLKLNASLSTNPTLPVKLLLTSNCIVTTEHVTESAGFAKAVIDTSTQFVRSFPYLPMSLPEFTCLCGVVLFAADTPKLLDQEQVVDNQIRAASALRKCCIRRHPNDPPRSGRLLLRLPTLRVHCIEVAASNIELADPVARNQLNQFISQNLLDTV